MERQIGAHYTPSGCNFTVWAPIADRVDLVLKSQDNPIALQKDPLGYWSVKVDAVQPGDLYKYKINGQTDFPDPASLSQPEGVHGFSQVVDLNNFTWTDASFKQIPLQHLIIYELHIGTFSPEGTFEGAAKKIAYLKNLGITAIEIMPVGQCAGNRNWGYDVVYPFAVQHSYGGPYELMKFINACHEAGISVIMDVIYNHLGPEGNYLPEYGPYYTEKYSTPWGKAINFDDSYSDEVRNYYLQNVLLWLKHFHIDGLRLDAVHAYKDFSAVPFLQQLCARVEKLNQEEQKQHILIGECDLNDPRYITSIEKDGMGLQAQWCDEFHHALHAYVTGETNGYYEDFGKLSAIYKTFRDGYVFTGEYSEHRKKTFGKPLTDEHHYRQLVVFSQNHDHIGNRMLGERLTKLVSFEALKLLAATVILSPAVPLLYMGEEYGEENPFLFFTDFSDSEIIEKVRKGRKEEFKSFKFEGDYPDPAAEETYQKSKLNWTLKDRERNLILLNWYKRLIKLRQTHPALTTYQKSDVNVSFHEEEQIITTQRFNHAENKSLYCIYNFNKENRTHNIKTEQTSILILNSAATEWLGTSGDIPYKISPNETVNVNAASILIYEQSE